MAVGDAYVFPGFLTPVLTLLFFPKPPTTFLTCFCRGERQKYAGRKVSSTGDQTGGGGVWVCVLIRCGALIRDNTVCKTCDPPECQQTGPVFPWAIISTVVQVH